MGTGTDNEIETQEMEEIVDEVCVRAGYLERCPDHEEVTDEGGDVEEALTLAEELVAKADPLVARFKGNVNELKAMIREAANRHGSECNGCAKRERE